MNVDGRPEVRGSLADRYHELMGFRQEAFERYRANDISVVAGPPVRVTFPSFGFRDQGMKHKRFGPLYVSDSPPMFSIVDRIFRERAKPFTILEIGPGRGDLARRSRRANLRLGYPSGRTRASRFQRHSQRALP